MRDTTDIIIRVVPEYGYLPIIKVGDEEIYRGEFQPNIATAAAKAEARMGSIPAKCGHRAFEKGISMRHICGLEKGHDGPHKCYLCDRRWPQQIKPNELQHTETKTKE